MSARVVIRRLILVTLTALMSSTSAGVPAASAAAAPTISGVRPASGPTTGGTKVQVFGADFTDVQSVTFGSTSAQYVVGSGGSSLVTTAPAHTTTEAVTVTVTTASGSASAPHGFRYTAPWHGAYGGSTTVDAPVDAPSRLSCPATHCYGMDDYGNFLEQGPANRNWINHGEPGGETAAGSPCQNEDHACASLSCPKVGYCVSVDRAGDPLIWSGGSWHVYPSLNPTGSQSFDHTPYVSCASTSLCMVFDPHGDYSMWDGTNWSPVMTTDGGAVTTAADESTFGMDNVSCAGTQCMMTNGSHARRYVSGAWTSPVDLHDLTFGANSLSCANVAKTGTTLFCVAGYLDGEGVYSRGAWHGPFHRFAAVDISCHADRRCLAMDDHAGVHVYNDADAANSHHGWVGAFPTPGNHLGSPLTTTCQAGTTCVTSIENGYTATFNLTTHKWSAPRVILTTSRGISALDCAHYSTSATYCLAGDVGPFLVPGDGSTWAPRTKVFGPGEQTAAVSCVSGLRFCMALANNNRTATKSNHYATYAKGRITAHTMITGTYHSLACWSETGCYALSDTKVLRWNGSAWSVAVDLAARHLHLVAITCEAGNPACLAVARNAEAYRVNGKRLAGPTLMNPSGTERSPAGVACQDIHHCIAVINYPGGCVDCGGGSLNSDTDEHWLVQGYTDEYLPYTAVSCAPSTTVTRCLAIGFTYTTTWDGAVEQQPEPLVDAYQTDVTCPTTSACFVADSLGRVQTFG